MSRRRSQLVAVAWAFPLAVNLATIASAMAQPTMAIEFSMAFVDDYPEIPGNELLGTYVVFNTSPPGDINNMIAFTLPAGSDEGVFDVAGPTGWLVVIEPHQTVFHGNGHIIRPGSLDVFYIYSTLLHVGQGEATAVAEGTTVPLPFNSVLVPVPGYHPLDRDQDADIDADDFAAFEACASGPAIAFAGDCEWADLDGDTDVDQADFGRFQPCLTAHGSGYIEGCETP